MIKNIVANFIGRFWSILSNFLFIPLYIHFLGFESYSIISFTLVIAGLMAILDAGLTATLSREFARLDNIHEEKIRIFKTLETSYFLIIGLSIFFVFTLSKIIARNWINIENIDHEKISFFINIVSFDVGFQLLLRFYMGGLLGLEKQIKANLYQLGWGVMRNGLVVLAIFFVPSLDMFFIWQTTSTFIFTILIRLSLYQSMTGYYKFIFKPKIETLVFKRIWRFAGGMLLISLVAGLNTQMDKIVISKLLPVESLGYYTLAVSLSMGIIVVVNPISIALLPRFTALYSANKITEAKLLFKKISLFVAILVFSIMGNMIFFSQELLWIWTGNMKLAVNSCDYLPIMSFTAAMLSVVIIPYNIAIANGYTKLNNILGLISLFLTLPGYWIATKYYGALGAASVFCIVQTIATFIYIYIINKKFIKLKSLKDLYIRQIFFPILISCVIAFLFSYIPNWICSNRIICLIWICISTIFTLGINTILLLPMNEIKNNISQLNLSNKFQIK